MAKNFGIPENAPLGKAETPMPEPEPGPEREPKPELVTITAAQLAAIIEGAVKAAVQTVAPQTPMTAEGIAAAIRVANEGTAEANAYAMKKALKPENDPAPMVSVYNPEGDRDHPRPALKCEFTVFNGIPIDGTTDTVEELTLFNRLVAGDYWVGKSDGSMMLFKVREHRNDLGHLRRIDISFPYRDDADRAGVMPMVSWLRDVVRQIDARQVA
jgi:hypothetical protein